MKVGFYFNDAGFGGLDLSDPCSGNNGVGGTQYCFLMVADAILKYTKQEIEVFFYAYHDNILPDGVQLKKIKNWKDMLTCTQQDAIDILVYKADGNIEMINAFKKTSLKCVAWAHNFLYKEELCELYNCENVRRVVFVGKQQYDTYVDHKIIEKATYIFNMFDSSRFEERPFPKKKIVTYTGSLGKTKGFHLLAFVWKDIVKAIPDAELYVIGSGQLYNRDMQVGPIGVARKEYEELFAPYLIENGTIMDSVHFLGALGKEKIDIYKKTMVGVMNPSGKSETFGLSGLEMEACGIPVVTKAKYGLFDTFVDGETGYLIKNQRQLCQAIIKLLSDKQLNSQMGHNAKAFADSHFQPEIIAQQWINMFEDVISGRSAEYIQPSNFMFNNKKWLRIFNRKLHFMHIPTASVTEIEGVIRALKMNLHK